MSILDEFRSDCPGGLTFHRDYINALLQAQRIEIADEIELACAMSEMKHGNKYQPFDELVETLRKQLPTP